jgi:hypothetical protein
VQPGEGKLHLGLDGGAAYNPEPGRLSDQLPEQGRLADSRLSPHDKDGALTISWFRYELPKDFQLGGPAE